MTGRYDVVYVGLSKSGMRPRLMSHQRSEKKAATWTHFSIYVVWDNVSDSEIVELEGLFRHIYRNDTRANRLNIARLHQPFKNVRVHDLSELQPV
jgi:hypothetical protein